MDRKGIAVFLGVVFLVTAVVSVLSTRMPAVAATGVGVLAFLLTPLIASSVAKRVSREPFPALRIWPLPRLFALAAVFGIPVVFAGINTLTSLLGWTYPDWELRAAMSEVPGEFSPQTVLALLIVLSVVAGATVAALMWLASETGWRGYLLPKLMPLGRVKACLVTGLLWSVWVGAVLGAGQWSEPGAWAYMLRWVLLGTAFGVVLSDVWVRRRHVGLTSLCCGMFWVQVEVWTYLFVDRGTAFSGSYSVGAIVAWTLVAIVFLLAPHAPEAGRPERAAPAEPPRLEVEASPEV